MTEYTREQILSMEASYSLNELVAEKVMGIAVTAKRRRFEYVHVPSYSRDISAAWEVVEKMKKDGWGFTLEVWGDDVGYRDDQYEATYGFQKGPHKARCDTAPEAICKSALLAVMNL